MVQMENGCICCTLREDLLEEVSKLALENRFDNLIIESTVIFSVFLRVVTARVSLSLCKSQRLSHLKLLTERVSLILPL